MRDHSPNLIDPFGGKLIDLGIGSDESRRLAERAASMPSIIATPRTENDLELLATGAFSPLDGFMNRADTASVIAEMRLANGTLFPIPVNLMTDEFDGLRLDAEIAIRTVKNDLLAVLTVTEIWEWSSEEFAQNVLGTDDLAHPLVAESSRWGKFFLSGPLRIINLPQHFDSLDLRLTPAETRTRLTALGNSDVVAFQTRNPLHRAHEELTKRAAELTNATLLIHPVVGLTKPGDIDALTRIRIYREVIRRHYDAAATLLAVTPLAMRMAGPREALWHAIIRRNYGANHLIVGRDHASPGNDSQGRHFYPPDAAADLVREYESETGVNAVAFDEMVYLADENRYEERRRVAPDARTMSISGTELRRDFLDLGRALPEWFTRPETAKILADAYPPREKQGFCLWFTGLSGAGKSTTAEVVAVMLGEIGRKTTVLDGDVVRLNLSKGLGFSPGDRDTNIRRIGFVAAEIVRHGGAVICAAISPYRATRDDVRRMIGSENFIEIFVDTPLEICEQRDSKGLYASARRGEITGFTGIDDPYEPPENAAIILSTVTQSPKDNALRVIEKLIELGFLATEK